MGFYDRQTINTASAVTTFTTRVYSLMALGLGVTALTAYLLAATEAFLYIMPFWWIISLGIFGFSLALNPMIRRLSIPAAAGMFLLFAALEGVLFGTILPLFAYQYGGQVIWTAFATASAVFLLSIGYGMFTKSDLTSLGRILSMALIGLVAITLLFMILSFFIPLGFFNLLIAYLGLGIFIGLTAYDAQTIKSLSMQADIKSVASYRLSLIMALSMYLNMIMIFWYLLRIFSSRRN